VLNANYWNQRYLKNETGWNIGTASLPIITYINQIDDISIKILIPGAGNAYEASYCFERNFKNIFVLDWSETAITNFKNNNSGFPGDQVFCQDFFEHKGQYDLILEQTFFCALHPKQRKDYVKKMYKLLKPSGRLVGVLFNKEFENGGPPYGAAKQTYKNLFKPFFHLKILENCYNSITPRSGSELFFIFIKRPGL